MTGEKTDKAAVIADIIKYGNQDGEMSWYYANALTQIHKTLTAAQKEALKKLRNLDVLPQGTYLYSDVIPVPENLNCDFLFTGTK